MCVLIQYTLVISLAVSLINIVHMVYISYRVIALADAVDALLIRYCCPLLSQRG